MAVNKSAFIIGSGPSLADVEMPRLAEFDTFSVNRQYIAYADWGFDPTYYVCIDIRGLSAMYHDINYLIRNSSIKQYFINGEKFDGSLHETDNVFLLNLVDDWGFGRCWNKLNYCGDVCAFTVQVAHMLGYKRVYLLGCDQRWQEREVAVDENDDDLIWGYRNDDINHFRPDYFGAGVRHSAPRADAHLNSWIQTIDEALGYIEIVSCAPGSSLNDYLPYFDYQKAIENEKENAKKVIEWIRENEMSDGGLRCWSGLDGNKAYPEITGYIIPSLAKYGEIALIKKFADWLLAIQSTTGAFPGMDGLFHTFDTAACMEGLFIAAQTLDIKYYSQSAYKALYWLHNQKIHDGILRRHLGAEDSALYTCRASWLMHEISALYYWKINGVWGDYWKPRERTHYIAYALEGLWHMGYEDDVRRVLGYSARAYLDGLIMPFEVNNYWVVIPSGRDNCATIQYAYLRALAGMEVEKYLDAIDDMVRPNGGIWGAYDDRREISWAAKYYLDLAYEVGK